MPSPLYDGTSAYKIDDYYEYTQEVSRKQEDAKNTKAQNAFVLRKKVMIATCAAFALAVAFLYANVMQMRAASKYEACKGKLEDIRVRNTQLAFDIASGIDLKVVEEKAKSEFGMQKPETHQNVYVDVVQSDYARTMKAPAKNGGIFSKAILGFKSFLAYIE